MSPATLTGTALEAALGYAGEHRLPVFAVATGDKRPHRRHAPNGFKDATLEAAAVRRVFEADPEANVAVATGCPLPGGGVLAAIDVDPRDGGDETLRAFVENTGSPLPETPEVATGGGGRHLYFRAPVGTRSTRLGPGLDLKAEGGYVVAPPSAHASGRLYVWHPSRTLGDVPLGALPACFLAGEDRGERRNGSAPPVEGPIPAGERNATMTSLAGTMRRRGMGEPTILAALREENRRCTPPLGDDELSRIAGSVARYEPAEDTTSGGRRVPRYPLTDLGNAERFASDHAARVRFVPGLGWHVWDGRRWRRDTTGAAMRLAWESARGIRDEARAIEDKDLADKVFKHATKAEARPRLEAMLGLAESAEGLVVEPDDLDADPMLLNVENGTLDLRSAALREQRPSDLLTKLAPVEFDPEATCPTFDRFLGEVLPDEEVRGYVQAVLGYCLTGDTSDQAVYLPEGPGANGKSSLLEAVTGVLGDYAKHADASTFTTQPRRGVRSDVARLQGARLVVATELEDDARLAEVLIKRATGGEKIVAARLYRDEFEFRPEFKAFLAVNRLPEVRGDDHAIWRRIRRIPFPTKVERPDKRMPEKLRAERAGILAWMVRGCLRWQREGLYPPAAVREATEDYRGRARHVDTVTRFVEERCRWGPDATAAPKALYDAYRTFCAEHGWRPVYTPRFKEELEALGAWRDDDDKRRLWRGIAPSEGAP